MSLIYKVFSEQIAATQRIGELYAATVFGSIIEPAISLNRRTRLDDEMG